MKKIHQISLAIFGLLVPFLSIADDWPQYGNYGGQQYTPLTQITADNLDQLEEVWRFRTGDLGQGFKYKGHSFNAGQSYFMESNSFYLHKRELGDRS